MHLLLLLSAAGLAHLPCEAGKRCCAESQLLAHSSRALRRSKADAVGVMASPGFLLPLLLLLLLLFDLVLASAAAPGSLLPEALPAALLLASLLLLLALLLELLTPLALLLALLGLLLLAFLSDAAAACFASLVPPC